MLTSLITFVLAYLVGSIPTGFLIARWRGVVDIRAHGSGNIGATNVARILGFKYFFLVFFIDASKAYLVLKLLAYYDLSQIMLIVAAYGLIIGNGASIFLQFRGGKGVATGFGILLALAPIIIPCAFAIWLVVRLITNTVGVASAVSLAALPPLAFYFLDSNWPLVGFICCMALWGMFLHRENIKQYVQNQSYPRAK